MTDTIERALGQKPNTGRLLSALAGFKQAVRTHAPVLSERLDSWQLRSSTGSTTTT